MSIPQDILSMKGKLIASCQSPDGDPFRDSESMARFAKACLEGGAAGIRANGTADIRAIRQITTAPIIGIDKCVMEDGRILITPTFEAARDLVRAGANLVALDVTARGQRHGAIHRLKRIKTELGVPVLADIATLNEALAAARAGADFVLSTLRGYTDETAHIDRFQPEFIEALVRQSPAPVIAEGRIHTPEQARQAICAGAWAVIVGTAITRPGEIAKTFSEAIEKQSSSRKAGLIAGIDLGGTATKFGLVSSDGSVSNEGSVSTPAGAGREALLDHLEHTARALLDNAPATSIAALGIATAGWVNVDTGAIAYATDNLPGWTGTPVGAELTRHLALPIAVENDANALALAEKQFGAGRGLRNFICVTLGTGVGGGCFVNGELNRGAHWFANAIGHLCLIPDGLPCTCGQRGCLEVYSNAAALMRDAGTGFHSAEDVIRAANEGDRNAIASIHTLAEHLARGLSILIQAFDPEAIVISGGLAQDNPLLFERVIEYLCGHVSAWEQRHLAVKPSSLGYHGGVLGAAAVALEKFSLR
jgi:N-acetylmannosamine-6-phosphate 2-epimerase/N-acetylmannosamine kinase